MSSKTDRRERLMTAATQSFLVKGLNVTTLANISEDADVPLGNVYYYFKTKNKIAEAVIDAQHNLLMESLIEFSKIDEPKARLAKLVQHCLEAHNDKPEKPSVLMLGLWNDVSLEKGELFEQLKKATQSMITWCAGQFEQLGKGNASQQHAEQLFAYLQGLLLYRKSSPADNMDTQTHLIATSLGFA